MSMSELHKEYFLRLSQHKELEGHLVQLMQRHHEVTARIVHTFCLFVLIHCSPQALSLYLANELGANHIELLTLNWKLQIL